MAARIGPRRPLRIYLAEWRESLGLTQERLAERVGVDKMSISRYERRQRAISIDVLHALAEALGIEATDLYRHPDQPSADALLRGQPPEIQAQAISIIEAIRKVR